MRPAVPGETNQNRSALRQNQAILADLNAAITIASDWKTASGRTASNHGGSPRWLVRFAPACPQNRDMINGHTQYLARFAQVVKQLGEGKPAAEKQHAITIAHTAACPPRRTPTAIGTGC